MRLSVPVETVTPGVPAGSSLSAMVSVWMRGLPRVYPLPLRSVSTTVSAPSRALSSRMATGITAVLAPAATGTVPEFRMVKSLPLPCVAVPPTP